MKPTGGAPPGSNTTQPLWPPARPPFLMSGLDPSSRPFRPLATTTSLPRLDPNAPAFVPKTAHVLPAAAAQVQVPTGPPPVAGTPNFVGSGKGFVPLCTAPPTPAPVAAPSPAPPPAEKKPLQPTMSWAKRCSAAIEEQPKQPAVIEPKRERGEAHTETALPEPPKPAKTQSTRKGHKRHEDPDAPHNKKNSRVNRRTREHTPKEDAGRTQETLLHAADTSKSETTPVAKADIVAASSTEIAAPAKSEVKAADTRDASVADKCQASSVKQPLAAEAGKSDPSPAAKPVRPLTRTVGQWAQVARGKQPVEPARSAVRATVPAEAVQSGAPAVTKEEPVNAPKPRGPKPKPAPRAPDQNETQQKQPQEVSASPKGASTPKAAEPTKPAEPAKVASTPKVALTPKAVEPIKAAEPTKAAEPIKAAETTKVDKPTKAAESTKAEEPAKGEELAKAEEPVRAEEASVSPQKLEEAAEEVITKSELPKKESSPETDEKAVDGTGPSAVVVVSKEKEEDETGEVVEEAAVTEEAGRKVKGSWGAGASTLAAVKAPPALPSVSGLSRAAKFGESSRMSTLVSSLKTQQGRLAGLDEKGVAEKAKDELPPLEHKFEAVPTASGTVVYAMSDMLKIRHEPMCMAAMESHRFPEDIVEPAPNADGSRAQFGTNPISAMLDMGRGMGKTSSTGGFNIPPALRKGMSTDFAASEALWSSGGAKPRHLGSAQNTTFGRSQTYADRPSAEREEWQRSGQRAIPTASATPAPLPEIPEDSWQIQQEKQKATGPRDVKVIRRLRAQLNKMTPKTYDDILKAILDIGIENMNEAQEFVNLIFDKAITNHGYLEMYADLCRDLGEELTARNLFPGKDKDGKDFRRLLLASCQQAFEKHLDQDFVAPEGISDEDRLELLLIHKEKMKGNLMFVACLGTRGLVVRRVLTMVMNNLLESSKSLQLEALASFLPLVIESLSEGKQATQFDQIFEKVEELSQDEKVEHRIQCLLKDTLDMRNAFLKTSLQNQMLERSKASRKGAWKAVMAESSRR